MPDQLSHERTYRVGVERFSPPAGEDNAATVIPGRPDRLTFFDLLAVMFAKHGHGFAVDADGPGPSAFGGSFDTLAAYDSSGSAEGHLSGVEVYTREHGQSCAN
jgi:hypothetical protein